MTKHESKKDEDVKKLKWYEDEDGGWTDYGIDSAKVWRTAYKGKEGSFYLEVYPLSLIDKDLKGWEYKIADDNQEEDGLDFDSAFSNINDSAPTANVAKKLAENTLRGFIKERNAKKRKYD